MEERDSARSKDDDTPIIGDYSDAQNAGLRARSRPEPPMQPPARPAKRTPQDDPLRADPGDVRRHARLRQERERVGPLGKLVRYSAAALVLAAAVAGYWNFDTLRQASVDFSAWTDLFASRTDTNGGTPTRSGEPETVSVEAVGVVGTEAATSLSTEAPPPAPPPANAVATASESAPAAAETQIAAIAAPAPPPPPPAPEPPPGPESFAFGLEVMNVSEADASAAIVVLRSGDRRRASSVSWWTKPGTATAGVDYADLGLATVRFAAGEQNRTIHVPLVGDRNAEGPENFYVYLAKSESAAAAGQADQQVEVIINDDD
jgi:hypothetical protein